MSSIVDEVASANSKVFKRAFIKRRDSSTGLFESDWLEITNDVKRWGKVGISTTPERPGSLRFSTAKLQMANDEGRYNPYTDPASLWSGFLDMQRTLVKIEYGFIEQTKSNGIWTNLYKPVATLWDTDTWDDVLSWDSDATTFIGIISGDPEISDKNRILLTVRPLNQLFKDYPARRLDGYTSTGLSASQFMDMVRDHTTGSGNFIFRPFFGDTTSNWDIQTTTTLYGDLNTSTAKNVIDVNVWKVMEKLSQAENAVPYVDNNGVFRFKSLSDKTNTAAFFFGVGSFNHNFGNTIKTVDRYGPRLEAYYSRVQVKFDSADTSTSYYVKEAALTITGNNDSWTYGYRTFEVENTFIPDLSTAQAIGDSLFSDLGSLKNEMTFRSSFIPHVKILDRTEITYDSTEPNPDANWNENDWNTELYWDDSKGDAIALQDAPHTILKVELDLDRFESRFIAREIL